MSQRHYGPSDTPPSGRIYVHSNWCYHDRLDGEDLRPGEVLQVEWPDGTIERVEVRVKLGRGVADVSVRTAYTERSYHGVQIEVPLIGRPAMRVSP